ncbi:MAG: glucosyltransferase domain-containing protein [Streptococcaceae bacterium]|nr:glucosyltransferase domain-containing protein [Streptococcaceae bacterium]
MKRKIFPILMIVLTTFLTYLPYFKNTFGIDTSTMMLDSHEMLEGYLSQGRFGIVWIFNLFIHHYDNSLVPFLVIPLLALAAVYLFYLIRHFDEKSRPFSAMTFAIFFVNNPVVYAQLYFKLQALEITLGLLFVLSASHICLTEKIRRPVKIMLSTVFLSLSILIYQSFAFFIFSLFLFWLLILPRKRKIIFQNFLPSLMIAGLIYLLTYLLYAMKINYSSYGSQTYLMWNKFASLGHLHQALMLVMLFGALIYLGLIFITIRRAKHNQPLEMLLIILLFLSLFSFNVAFGTSTKTPRIYFGTFSAVVIGLLYYWNKPKFFGILAIVSMIFTFSLSFHANQAYQNDLKLTNEVADQISQHQAKTVVFIGNLQEENLVNEVKTKFKVSAASSPAQEVGMLARTYFDKFQDIFITGATRSSFFQFDDPLTSGRPYNFMTLQGHAYPVPEQALRTTLVSKYAALPNYPNPESVKFDSNSQILVFKLSN